MPKTTKCKKEIPFPYEDFAPAREIGGKETIKERIAGGLVDENELIAELKCLVMRTRRDDYRPVTMSKVEAEVVLWKTIRTFCRSDEEFAGVRRSFENVYLAHLPSKARGPASVRISSVTKLLRGGAAS